MVKKPHTKTKQRLAFVSDHLLTKKELAKRLRVSTRTIDLWVNQGRITKIKIASTARFDWNDVLAELKAGKEVA